MFGGRKTFPTFQSMMHGTKEEIDPTGLAAEEAAYAAQLAEIRREGADATPMGTNVSPANVSPSSSASRRAPPSSSNPPRNTSSRQYAHNLSMSSSSTDSDDSSTSVSMSSFMESFSGSDFGF